MKKKKIRLILIIICLAILTGSLIYIFSILSKEQHSREVNEKAVMDITHEDEEFWYDHEAALKINPDAKGLIDMPAIGQRLPIVQRLNDPSNEYYLHRGFDGNYSWAGTPYIDTKIEEGLDAKNVIIYGHHMGDHTMFSDNDKYREESFYFEKGHDKFYIYTPTALREYKIFAAYTYPKSGEAFTIGIKEDKALQEYAQKCKTFSFYDTKVDVSNATQVVTLVSCDVKTDYQKRMVVQGILTKETDMANVIKKHKQTETSKEVVSND